MKKDNLVFWNYEIEILLGKWNRVCHMGIKNKVIEIYYVEDDENIAQMVQKYLDQQACQVKILKTMTEARQALKNHMPSIVLVDWNLPDGRGDTLCRWIRSMWQGLPLIFLTVRGDTRDIVSGFRDGADDYVVKPFELEVLYSRILALLRRAGDATESRLFCDGLSLDQEKLTVFCNEVEVVLSQTEYQLLWLLMKNKGRTITREQLLEQIWDSSGNYVNDNTLTVTMKRLREKLHNPACLKTIRSFGYRMEDSV